MEVKQVHNQPAQGKEAASAAGPRPRPAGGSLPPGFESHKTPERENPLSVDCGTPLPVRFNLRLIPQYTDLSLLMTRLKLIRLASSLSPLSLPFPALCQTRSLSPPLPHDDSFHQVWAQSSAGTDAQTEQVYRASGPAFVREVE
eukprot:750462-Hanusia_phi.AAC.5